MEIINLDDDCISLFNKRMLERFERRTFIYDLSMNLIGRTFCHKSSVIKHQKILKGLFRRYTGKKILDIACGTGASVKYFNCDNEYTGIDLSKAMLLQARKKVVKKGFRKVRLYAGNCENMIFEDDEFSVILMDTALHLIENYRSGIKEALRVLSPGGRFYCSFPCMGILKSFDKSWIKLSGNGAMNRISEDDIRSFCRELSLSYKKEAVNGAVLYFSIGK